MAVDWYQTTLDQLGRIVTGKTPRSRRPEYFGGEIPFVTPTDFDGSRRIETTHRCLTERGASAVRCALIPREAIMVSCIGSDMGKSAIADAACVTNQQINSIVVESPNCPLFVYYNLSIRKEEIRAASGGSAQPILNKSTFGQLDILLPPPPEQRAIANILGTLDDKIELNRRMNETLEAMARALFKDWFVDFGPTRAKAEGRDPYLAPEIWDLFPDKLDDGRKPEGWAYRPVSAFSKIKGGKQLTKDNFVESGPHPVFGGAGIMGYTDRSNADGFVISVGRVGAYCGQFFSFRGKAWINNNASQISPFEAVSGEWLLLNLRALDIDLIKKGAAQPFVSNSDIAAMKIIDPGEKVLESFHEIIAPLAAVRENNDRENSILTSLRNLLLPGLMGTSKNSPFSGVVDLE